MKKPQLILSAVVTLMLAAVLLAKAQPAKDASTHLGTWQLVSSKYGDDKEFSDAPKDTLHVKIINGTHFIWVIYDAKTKLVSSSLGGHYSLTGGKYTENVEWFLPQPMKEFLGKQEFTIKVEGDKLTQSGKLSNGINIEEVWQRVK